jgi:hypothetical protein
MQSNCSSLNDVTGDAVKQFAGQLYTSNEKFVPTFTSDPFAVKANGTSCKIEFQNRSPSTAESTGYPQSRLLTVVLKIDTTSDNPVSATENYFAEVRSRFTNTNTIPLSGIGDEAFSGADASDSYIANFQTVFRISNLLVTVIAGAQDYANSGLGNDIDTEKSGSESVARAIASQIDRVMSTR